MDKGERKPKPKTSQVKPHADWTLWLRHDWLWRGGTVALNESWSNERRTWLADSLGDSQRSQPL